LLENSRESGSLVRKSVKKCRGNFARKFIKNIALIRLLALPDNGGAAGRKIERRKNAAI